MCGLKDDYPRCFSVFSCSELKTSVVMSDLLRSIMSFSGIQIPQENVGMLLFSFFPLMNNWLNISTLWPGSLDPSSLIIAGCVVVCNTLHFKLHSSISWFFLSSIVAWNSSIKVNKWGIRSSNLDPFIMQCSSFVHGDYLLKFI